MVFKTVIPMRENKQRDAQKIIVELLRELQDSSDDLSRTTLSIYVDIGTGRMDKFFGYLHREGLIEAPIHRGPVILTDEGRRAPLTEEHYNNFRHKSGYRTTEGIRNAIRNVTRQLGQASISDIGKEIGTYQSNMRRYLDDLESKGDMMVSSDGKYTLTKLGLSKVSDTSDTLIMRANKTWSTGTGEIFTRMLDEARGGTNKTRLLYSNKGTRGTFYLDLLIQCGLLLQSDGLYYTTKLYDEVDAEALPYALSVIVNPKHKGRSSLHPVDILNTLSEPRSAYHVANGIRTNHSTLHKPLDMLVEKHYVSTIPKGKRTLYQRTPEGEDFLKRVDGCLEKLMHAKQSL